MEKFKKIFSLRLFVLLSVLTIVPTVLPLFHKGFFPTQDYIYVARVYELDRGLSDGQFPVRWAEDFRYGDPTFNFYAPLPYYVGSLIYKTGLSLLDANKVLIALGFLLASLAMFFLARDLFGNWGGVIAASFYTMAPYHSVDIYVRGALSEAWALVFLPLTFLFSLKLARKFSMKNFIFLSLALAGLFYTHNVMTMIFMPFYLGWLVFLIWRDRSLKLWKPFLGTLLLGFGLSASFLLPALFEKNLVQSIYLTGGYFDFRGHFVEIKQFFATFWGYGASLWGPNDGMSFQVGVPQWVGFGLVLLSMPFFWLKNKKIFWLVGFLASEFLFSLFMQHNKSTPIWLLFPILRFVQFPWRFLGISIFLISIIAGSLGVFKNKWLVLLGILLVGFNIGFNFQFFHPESYTEDAVDNGYIGSYTLSRDERIPRDYLPVYVKKVKGGIEEPFADSGSIQVLSFMKHSSWATSSIIVSSPSATVELPLTYFPGWTAKNNGQNINIEAPGDYGLIKLDLPKGRNNLSLNFGNTPVRFWSDLVSIIAVLGVLILATYKKWRKYLSF